MIKTSRLLLLLAIGLLIVTPLLAKDDVIKLSGAHFNLNLLGKDNCPGGDMTDSSRHTIFVKLNFSDPDPDNILGNGNVADVPDVVAELDKTNKIFLAGGDAFEVTDGNACNKGGAAFTLPWDVASSWEIYVRALGKPGGTGDIVLCGIADNDGIADPSDGDEIVCNSEDNDVDLERKAGRSLWKNVTRELTTLEYLILTGYDANGDPVYVADTAVLFDSDFYQYFWDYDNNGLRLVQLRFYPK
jgi:hypothetical protein